MNRSQSAQGLAVRRIAAFHLARVLAGAPFVPIDENEISDGRDRALANRLISMALRRHGQISTLLEQYLKKGVPKRSGLFEVSLRIGLSEILFVDPGAAHAGVHLAVETIKADQRGRPFAGLANAVLRNVTRQPGLAETLAGSRDGVLPEELADRWRDFYGPQAVVGMADALLAGAPLDLTGRGPRFPPPPGQRTLGYSYRLAKRDSRVADLDGFAEGNWWIQDLAATIPAHLLHVVKGETVADLCAAPGGKSAQLANGGAKVTAVENNPKRMARLRENLARLQLDGHPALADGAEYGAPASFDKVLADLPCSATGTFRRHPEVLWRQQRGFAKAMADVQKKILANGARLTRPGGILVFATCSLEPEEGEELAAWFVSRFDPFEAFPVSGDELEGWVEPISKHGYVRTLPGMAVPGGAEGTLDGFFVARFRRLP